MENLEKAMVRSAPDGSDKNDRDHLVGQLTTKKKKKITGKQTFRQSVSVALT